MQTQNLLIRQNLPFSLPGNVDHGRRVQGIGAIHCPPQMLLKFAALLLLGVGRYSLNFCVDQTQGGGGAKIIHNTT
jgi:hypothetical protein